MQEMIDEYPLRLIPALSRRIQGLWQADTANGGLQLL